MLPEGATPPLPREGAVRSGRWAGAAAVLAVAALWVALGVPAGAAQADCGSLCTPEGLAVLGDSNAFSAGLGTGTEMSSALALSDSAAGGTSAAASGVGGVTFGQAVAGGAPVLVGGSIAAYVGINKWAAGSVNVAQGGATGLVGGGSIPAGYSVSPTFPSAFGAWPPDGSTTEPLTVSFAVDAAGSIDGTFTFAPHSGEYMILGARVVTYGSADWPTGAAHPTLVPLLNLGGVQSSPTVYSLGPAPSTRYVVEFGPMPAATTSGVATGIWVPAGDPISPPASTGGAGTITRTLTCTNGSTTSVETDTIPVNVSTGGSYSFGDLNCPAGMVVKTFKADLTPSSGGSTQAVIPETASTPQTQSVPSQYPACLTGVCLLRLFKLQPAGTPEQSCGDLAVACPDWYADPNRSSDYECRWGSYVVPTDECSVYRVPGELLPNTQINPDGTTTYLPWPPLPAPTAAANPGAASQGCFPSGWSAFNPVQWVLMPVQCALSWAFVPSSATSTDWQTFVSDVQTHPPVSIAVGGVQFTNDVIAGVNGQGDCSNVPLEMADSGLQGAGATFDLCAGVKAVAGTTWGQAVELVVTVAIIGWASWIVMHRVGRSFGSKA